MATRSYPIKDIKDIVTDLQNVLQRNITEKCKSVKWVNFEINEKTKSFLLDVVQKSNNASFINEFNGLLGISYKNWGANRAVEIQSFPVPRSDESNISKRSKQEQLNEKLTFKNVQSMLKKYEIIRIVQDEDEEGEEIKDDDSLDNSDDERGGVNGSGLTSLDDICKAVLPTADYERLSHRYNLTVLGQRLKPGYEFRDTKKGEFSDVIGCLFDTY